MFNSFEGDFRRKPTVSMRGSSTAESKEQLLLKAQQERKRREAVRLQNASAVKIQSAYRAFIARKHLRNQLRQSFDLLKTTYKTGDLEVNSRKLAALLLQFFDPVSDGQRLTWLCQAFVASKGSLVPVVAKSGGLYDWPFRVARLLIACMSYMAKASSQDTISSTLRFVEVYSSPETYDVNVDGAQVDSNQVVPVLYSHLMTKDYFGYARQVCDARVPPLLQETFKPPTQHAEAVLTMISRPINVLNSYSSITHDIREKGMLNLVDKIFAQPFSEQIELFILPALSQSQNRFPFAFLCDALSKRLSKTGLERTGSAPWLLYSFLKLGVNHSSSSDPDDPDKSGPELAPFLDVVDHLTRCLMNMAIYGKGAKADDASDDSDSDDDDNGDDDVMDASDVTDESKRVARDALDLLNDEQLVLRIVERFSRDKKGGQKEVASLKSLCRICHHLLVSHPLALHKFRLLYTLAFRPGFLHNLWNSVLETKRPSLVGNTAIPLITIISRGSRTTATERDEIVPLLAVFAALFGYLLVTIHDTEFYGESQQHQANIEDNKATASPSQTDSAGKTGSKRKPSSSNTVWMPFTLCELVPMSLALRDVTLGLVELAFPETRPVVREDYQSAVKSFRLDDDAAAAATSGGQQAETTRSDVHIWSHLFRTTVELVRQLYTRDTRRQFCPDDHWINDRITLPGVGGGVANSSANDLSLRRSRLRQYRPFQGLRCFTREELVEEGPPLSAKEVRLATVLRELPYAISFEQRVHVFHSLVAKDKDQHQGEMVNFGEGKQIHAHIRRNFIYEDAFEKLSEENEPNLKLKLRIQLANAAGLDEAGIDGGGLFREFMTELIKTSFDPNRGFFRITTDQQLYPNPSVDQIERNYVGHYYFIGRILGKALYENMLVELPLTSFFMSKLLGQKSVNVDIDHLSSLDPELYKNLLYLKVSHIHHHHYPISILLPTNVQIGRFPSRRLFFQS